MARAGWNVRDLPDLSGKTYLVTGATAGLGYFSSEQLARAGASVIVTGRSPNKLALVRATLAQRVPDAAVQTLLLDTSNLGSVRAAAATARARGRLDGLLLNAGIVHPPRHREVVDGNERVFATNVLGHFALAGELLQPLAAAAGRMVWLGSISTSLWRYDPVDPQLISDYSPWRAYVQSKVATTAVGLEADRRLRAAGVPAGSVVVHPGYARGGRTRGIRGINEPSRMSRFLSNLQAPISQSKEEAAGTLVRALIDPGIHGGEFWGPRFLVRGGPTRSRAAALARSAEVAERLWRVCEEATGVRWPFGQASRPAS